MTEERPPPPVYGVDFGMTTSSLAVAVGEGRPRLVEDPAVPAGGAVLVPTAVCLDPRSDRFLVGTAAVNARQVAPELYRDQFKRYVDGRATMLFGGREIPVERLVATVLGFLRGLAVDLEPEPPARVVLTVPASWQDRDRGVMKAAAARAGFAGRSLVLVEEPTAAFTHARTLAGVDETRPVLVYDLGGSTFDCALLVPDDGTGAPRLYRDGLVRLGGTDFDGAVLDHLAAEYPAVGDFRATAPDRSPVLAEVLRSCERIKRRLSDIRLVEERLVELPGQPVVRLSRDRFEALIDARIRRTVDLCTELLDTAGLRADQVRTVLPVGGSSRIPLVRARLEELFPGSVVDVPEPELAVVRGAVTLAREEQYAEPDPAGPPVFAEPADPGPAELVGVPAAPRRPGRARLGWLWVLSLAWLGGAAGLAAWAWSWPGWLLVAVLVLVNVAVLGRLTPYPRSDVTSWPGWLIGISGIVLPVLGLIIYAYRTLGEGRHEWPVIGWLAGIGVVGVATLFVALAHGDGWSGVAAAEERAVRLAAVAEEVRERRWFGPGEDVPELFRQLLTIPSVRGFDLHAGAETAFQYALTSGDRAVLVYVARSGRDRPVLRAALDTWESRLGAASGVGVLGLIVFPGNRMPPMPESERALLVVPVVSARFFTDVAGRWLGRRDTVDVRLAEPLLATGPGR